MILKVRIGRNRTRRFMVNNILSYCDTPDTENDGVEMTTMDGMVHVIAGVNADALDKALISMGGGIKLKDLTEGLEPVEVVPAGTGHDATHTAPSANPDI